jgi:hypothetical protein
MMQRNYDKTFERVLKGPKAYDRFNKISKICQEKYTNSIKAQNALLILIAILSSIPLEKGQLETTIRYIIVALSVIILGIIILQQTQNYMQGWQNARFIAESVLSNCWLFSFKVAPYDSDKRQAIKSFLETVEKIEKEVELKRFYSIYSSNLDPVSSWMNNLYDEGNMQEKKSFYIEYRLDNQINWYTQKANINRKNSDNWFLMSLGLLIAGIVLTLFIALYEFSILGFLSTVAATILTWRQTKRFDELKVTYAVAAKELESIKGRFQLEDDAPDIIKFVEETEKSISREHKLWFNWTYIN